ncbi:MAG: hypothetical protein GY716_02260 [bacterium]|nr:hypothetical protein [bacterium]
MLLTIVPLWLPKFVAVGAGCAFVLWTDARRWTKVAVAVTVLGSLVLDRVYPGRWTSLASLLLQVVVSVYCLIYFKLES